MAVIIDATIPNQPIVLNVGENTAEAARNAALSAAAAASAHSDALAAAAVVASATYVTPYTVTSGAASAIPAALTAVMVAGYAAAGDGGMALYVRVASEPAHGAKFRSTDRFLPNGSTSSGNGGWWELVQIVNSIHAEACGAVGNNTGVAVANVQALRVAQAFLDAKGGGIMAFGARTYTLDAATLGANGIVPASSTIYRGVRACTVVATTDQTAGMMFSANAAISVTFEDIELRGRWAFTNLIGGGMLNCIARGMMTSSTQYAEVSVDFAGAFGGAGQLYSDGSITGGYTDMVTAGSAQHGVTFSKSGTTISALSPATGLGSAQWMSYELSDSITLNPAKRYVARYNAGFLTGNFGILPMILCYDASDNPVDLGSSQGRPKNAYFPSEAWQNGGVTAVIHDTAKIKLALGIGRDYSTPVSQTANWDVSKIQIFECVADTNSWLTTIFSGAAATPPTITSPANVAQGQYASCTGLSFVGNHFTMVDRCALKLIGCTNSCVTRNRWTFCMQCVTDDAGVGNSITHNWFDGRFYATLVAGGTGLVGARAMRLRAIGGQSPDQVDYSHNWARGYSWTIEVLFDSLNRGGRIDHNRLWPEFCAISGRGGTWGAASNRAMMPPDGHIGIEVPGGDGIAGIGYGKVKAVLDDNHVEWIDGEQIGERAPGISVTDAFEGIIRGGKIIAPHMIQFLADNYTSGKLIVDGVDGAFGISALIQSNGNATARFGKIAPLSSSRALDKNPNFPTNAYSGVFDCSTPLPVFVGAQDVDPGKGPVANIRNCPRITYDFPLIRITDAANPDYYLRASAAGSAMTVSFLRANFQGFSALSIGAWRWATVNGSVPAGSKIGVGNVSVDGAKPTIPGGTYARSMLEGEPLLLTYDSATLASVTVGPLSAGGNKTITGISLLGACAGRGNYWVGSTTPGGLADLVGVVWATADDTVTLKLTAAAAYSNTTAQNLFIGGRL